MTTNVPVLHDADLDSYLSKIPVLSILEDTFSALHDEKVVQPPQTLTIFPENRGDFITYLGVLSPFNVFGAKLSPYIPTQGSPIITAWTVLMSMTTGLPLLLCDSGRLTRERTAATTALAVNKLARKDSTTLAIIGSGSLALAHLHYVLPLRSWTNIRVYSPQLSSQADRQSAFRHLAPGVTFAGSSEECVRDADVVMLVTSSGSPVVELEHIKSNALVTSISTNAANAHEISPEALPQMDVYCDYKATTPQSAGEMVLAARQGNWSANLVKGDLADLCSGVVHTPQYKKPVFFRSIGLGIEDIAIAYAIFKQLNG